ncbi:MAG TPA: putative porin, partial [Sphingomonadaceae bacterium]|nr:putative porin [Sphingomonadaceae bacterium]
MTMPFRKSLIAGTAMALLFAGATPASAQSTDDIGVELLQLLVDEGVISRDKAEQLIDKAREAAQLRAQREEPRTAATIDVPYVPQALREQIRDEVKQEVVAQAKNEGWIAPNTLPAWAERISISGDMRLRYEMQNYSDDNFPFFPDIGAINLAGGVKDAEGFPLLNSLIDRNRVNYRARLDIKARISDRVRAGLRLASGNERGAVSTNATMGDFFLKDNFWLDRAYLEIEPVSGVVLTGGRMPNPFETTDMVWDADINPEGVSLAIRRNVMDGFEVFGTAAYLPMEERAIFKDSFMIGGQLGVNVEPTDGFKVALSGSYYDFRGIQSQKNAPDGSRLKDYTAPRFLDKGNSVFNMRTDGLTTLAGLASDFNLLIGNIRVSQDVGPLVFSLTGEVVKNLAVDAAEIALLRGEPGVKPGDLGWQVRFEGGNPKIERFGQWQLA